MRRYIATVAGFFVGSSASYTLFVLPGKMLMQDFDQIFPPPLTAWILFGSIGGLSMAAVTFVVVGRDVAMKQQMREAEEESREAAHVEVKENKTTV